MATWRPFLFFDPHGNTVLAFETSNMKFHLALFSLPLSELERSIQVTQVFNGPYLQIYSRQDLTTELLLVMDRKSYMRFHLEPLSLTLSDLERSIQVTDFHWPISPNLFKITTELLLMMDRKSYMGFNLAPLSLTLSDLEKSIQVTQIFTGLYLKIYSR